jgi:hypothetical protein
MYFSASAQHLRPHDIPQVRLSDFQASVKTGAPYPVYLNVRIFYRLDSVNITPENTYRLKVITMVVPYAPGSFFNVKQIDPKQIPQLLEHERGHLIVGYITANRIEKELSASIYSADYLREVKIRFDDIERSLSYLHGEYDAGTNHSIDTNNQKKCFLKLKNMFEETFGGK